MVLRSRDKGKGRCNRDINSAISRAAERSNQAADTFSFLCRAQRSCENIHKLTVVRQYVVLQCAFQVETMLADVALESSHARVRQLVRLQHRRSLELRRTEIARERRVRGMDDHVGPEATGSQEALAAGRAYVGPHVNVHQLMIAQRLMA